MPFIVAQAARIVAEREFLYHVVTADMYFMALLDGDKAMAQLLWREAWEMFNGELLALLLSAAFQLHQTPFLSE